jgi:hypothetical protein
MLVIAVASLFASDPILENQQALAANAAGSGFGGGSFVSGGGSLGGKVNNRQLGWRRPLSKQVAMLQAIDFEIRDLAGIRFVDTDILRPITSW